MAIRWNARYLHDACCMSNLNLELFGFHCSKQLSNSPCYKSGFGLYLSDSDESVDSTVEKREEQADEWEEEAGLREQEANIVHMEKNEWEEDEEEVMEEERYIIVLHNRLRREEFEKVKRLRNSNMWQSRIEIEYSALYVLRKWRLKYDGKSVCV